MNITVKAPKNPDESLALAIIQAVWPIFGYLQDAPSRLRLQVKVAMSHTAWDSMCILQFHTGMSPVDPIARTLFGREVVVNNWPRDRVELVLPVFGTQEGAQT